MTTALERDGFCSGGDDDEGFYSHTDASDDSADIKMRGSSQLRNKRKCTEPRRLDTDLPAKKRKLDIRDTKISPFRPWSGTSPPISSSSTPSPIISPPSNAWVAQKSHVEVEEKLPYSLTVPVPQFASNSFIPVQNRLMVQQDEPLSLVSKKTHSPHRRQSTSKQIIDSKNEHTKRSRSSSSDASFKMDTILSLVKQERTDSQSSQCSKGRSSQPIPQRNYKNMTRERRIEANARERTRVHTISAAFDTLRSSIPAYSHNQKLSKLSVLRIACSYIMTLSRLSGEDYSADSTSPDLSDCVSNVSRTIQTEGKVRKKKDE